MKRLPITISTFSKLINNNCVYVDKTKYIYDLFKEEGNYYFLSRPRRFGKSLLVSTLKEFFLGNKELFKDLWIEKSDYAWQEYPIIMLDFSAIAHRTPKTLEESMNKHLNDIAELYGLTLVSTIPEDNIYTLVKKLAEKNKVVLLIDEYDKPILDHVNNIEIAGKNRDILKSFYEVIKSLDAYFHAIFITGVTKVSKTSIFSGMNNLNDISLTPETSTLLGYTQEELEYYFLPFIEEFSQQKNIPFSAVMEEMKTWYNGYRFSKSEMTVYNPFSILYYLNRKECDNYWFESGTPSFLIELLKNNPKDFEQIETGIITSNHSLLGSFDIGKIPTITLLYQAGYLTIQAYDEKLKIYLLTQPNKEVKESMAFISISLLTHLEERETQQIISNIKRALIEYDIDDFCKNLQILFASISFNLHIEQERYYHSLFHMMAYILGLEIYPEVATSKGRIDFVIITDQHILIFEFKFEESGQKALEQILERRYYEKYLNMGKKITLIGLSFNYKDKKLTLDWVIQPYGQS